MIGVGIIGTGVGLRTLLPGFRRTGAADIVALSGSSKERAEAFGAEHAIPFTTEDYREVCDHPAVDLICVASPNALHLPHARYALMSKRHVYLEKPTGISGNEADEIADLVDSGSPERFVVVGHQLRFNPYLKTFRDLVMQGEIGRVYFLTFVQHGGGFSDPARQWTWEFEPNKGGGVRLAMGSHLLDLATFILSEVPLGVRAHMDAVHRLRTPEGERPRECRASNFFSAEFEFPETTVHVSSTAAAHSPLRFDVVAYGETGELRFDLDDRLRLYRRGEGVTVLDEAVDAEYQLRQASSIFSTSFTYFADEIVRSIKDGSTRVGQAATAREAANVVKWLDLAASSYTAGTVEWLTRPVIEPIG